MARLANLAWPLHDIHSIKLAMEGAAKRKAPLECITQANTMAELEEWRENAQQRVEERLD